MDLAALRMQRVECTVKFVKSFATWHWFDVDSNFLSYPAPLFLVIQFRLAVHLLVVITAEQFQSDHTNL